MYYNAQGTYLVSLRSLDWYGSFKILWSSLLKRPNEIKEDYEEP